MNSLAWHFDNHGRFSVKSAYSVGWTSYVIVVAQGGSRCGTDCIWKNIWRLNCPNKIKHFLWRMAHNSHPLRCNLAQRGMHIDIKCPVCGCIGEDGGHLIFKCKLAKQLWRLLRPTGWHLKRCSRLDQRSNDFASQRR